MSIKIYPLILFFLVVISYSNDDFLFNFKASTEYSSNIVDDTSANPVSHTFQGYGDLYLQYKQLSLNFNYGAFIPPRKPSFDESIRSTIYFRSINYEHDNISVTAGNSYVIFGNGSTLRLFADRQKNWLTMVDGMLLQFDYDKVNFKILGGLPISENGDKLSAIYGSNLLWSPIDNLSLGFSFVLAPNYSVKHWESLQFMFNFPTGNIQMEFGGKEFSTLFDLKQDKALHLVSNFNFGEYVTFLGEFRYYNTYDLTSTKLPGTLHQLPAGQKKYTYSLPNKSMYLTNPDNEMGYLLESSVSFKNEDILTLSIGQTYSFSDSMKNTIAPEFHDFFLHYDFTQSEKVSMSGGVGLQQSKINRYYNFSSLSQLELTSDYSLQFGFEHQFVQGISDLFEVQPQYYNQMYTATLSKATKYSISLLMELSSNPQSKSLITFGSVRSWIAAHLDIHFNDKLHGEIFLGLRQKGKICTGGSCIERPELKGGEITLNYTF